MFIAVMTAIWLPALLQAALYLFARDRTAFLRSLYPWINYATWGMWPIAMVFATVIVIFEKQIPQQIPHKTALAIGAVTFYFGFLALRNWVGKKAGILGLVREEDWWPTKRP
jgi:hypothetical protein